MPVSSEWNSYNSWTYYMSPVYFISIYLKKYKWLGWLNELGRWIWKLIQAYHQYGVGSLPAL